MTRKIFALAICILTTILTVSAQTPPDNEVWYTTTDGKIAELYEGDENWGIQIISHTYDNGKGVVRANRAIEYYGIWEGEGEYGFEITGNHIETITLPNSVTKIEGTAFNGCTRLKACKGKYASADGRCLIINGVLEAFISTGLTSYTIPCGVTKIDDDAFSGCTNLNSITIPDSVTKIGEWAFSDCTSLTSITIPDSVTEIGNGAFRGCTGLPIINKIRYADTYLVEAVDKSLTSYTIKAGTRFIGNGAFSGCTSLTSITIPDSVTEIGYSAFEGCTSLTNITIPDNVTKIGGWAFIGCTSLNSINIPDSVTEIEYEAFRDCTSLPIINNIRYADTYLVEAVDKSLTSYTIKAGTRFIGYSAFRGCTRLTSITIPDSVTKIGYWAFSDCTRLTSITIPDSVTKIGYCAFLGCTSLTSITIPDSVTEIGANAFNDCTSLTNITIPDSVTEISGGAFEGCTSLKSFKYKYASADGRCLIKDAELIAFAPAGLTSYTIPDSITEIGDGAFKNCTNLTSITIPNSVTEIGYEAFDGCTSLTNITIPDSVTEIGEYAFSGCNIEQITISAVTGNIFGGCDGLDPSKVVAYTGKYASEDGRCLIKDGVLIDYIHNGAERYEIPNGVTIISDEVFKGCSSLKSITIPESVTSIGSSAFKGCTSLTDITMPNSGIGIEYNAFEGYNIKQITINAVTGNIFRGCNGLGPSKVVAYTGKYASEDGRCLIKDGVLIDIIHTGLTSYDIPDGVTTIPDDTFRGCTKLASLTLPQSLTTIGERAFMGCGITEITIPQGVTTIGQDVFKECPLTIVINCLATTPPQIATLGIGEEIVIYVPKESVKLYKKANVWMDYKKQIRPIKE